MDIIISLSTTTSKSGCSTEWKASVQCPLLAIYFPVSISVLMLMSVSLSHTAIFYAKINSKYITVTLALRSTLPFSPMLDCNSLGRHFE